MLKNQLRHQLAQMIAEADLTRWFDPLDLIHSPESTEVVVEFPHAYFAQWFDSHIKDQFEQQLSLILGQGHVLRYRNKVAERAPDASALRLQPVSIDFPFGHEFTFEQFFTNHKNLFPLASAKEIAKSREVKFSPLGYPRRARHRQKKHI